MPAENQVFVLAQSRDVRSSVLNHYSDQSPDLTLPGVQWIEGRSEECRVDGLTHLAVHVSPENPHYGSNGDYRACRATDCHLYVQPELPENGNGHRCVFE